MTQGILKAGYNIDSMLLAYANKDIDWRESHNWNCNNNQPPTETNTYFGATTHPFEVVGFLSCVAQFHPLLTRFDCIQVVFFKKHWDSGDVQKEAFDRYSKWIMQSTRVGKLLDAIDRGEIELAGTVQEELNSLQEAPRTFDPFLPHFQLIEDLSKTKASTEPESESVSKSESSKT